MLTVVADGCLGDEGGMGAWPSLIDEVVRGGVRRMLAGALRAAVGACVAGFAGERGGNGCRLVACSGCYQGREVLAFCDYPGGRWVHLRAASPLESTFTTVRHRTKVTTGPGWRAAGLAMAFKLIGAAQDRWRAASAPHLAALVRAGAVVRSGVLADRPEQAAAWPQ